MSYILDALRRADAERDRGGVPSLHTQQYGALPGDDDEPPQRSRLLIGAIVVLVMALASVLLRSFFGGSGNESAPTKTIAQAPVTAPPAPTVPPTPVVVPAPLPVLPSTSAAATIAPAAPAARPAAKESAAPSRAPTREAAASAPARNAAKAASRREAAASTAAAATAGERVYAIGELPEAIRRDLPKLAFGGSAYSNDATSRMVILNGQVFHEGDTVARGLVLHTVKRKSAVLSFNGYRYEFVF